jgi:hypothetical protein
MCDKRSYSSSIGMAQMMMQDDIYDVPFMSGLPLMPHKNND